MEITALLQRLQHNDRDAMNLVIPLVYKELKKLAKSHLRREGNTPSLQTTVLVHEAYLKLVGSRHPAYENRSHFFGIASRLMRQVLVEAARARAAEKRSARQEVALVELSDWGPKPDQSLMALEDALQRVEQLDPLKGRLIEMRFFGGMTAEESAEGLSIPVHVVRRELRLARAMLRKELAGAN
jgi:RNA polymerase sigma factor (TIGR02999 family)